MKHAHFALVPVLLLLDTIGLPTYAEPPWADRAAWEQVDIVPMPKRIRLTGRRLPLDGGAIVLGRQPSEQDGIGAKWISDHIIKKGGQPLPVIGENELSRRFPLRIYVGTRQTCKAIDEAAGAKMFRLGPGVPGKRGYVIQPRRKGASTDLLLGGADPIGALYACVTLAGLLGTENGNVVVREAEVVDWPDYPTATHGLNLCFPELGGLGPKLRWAEEPTEEQKREYLRLQREHLDRLLQQKISCFKVDKRTIGPRYWRKLTPEFTALYRQVTSHAMDRGIRSLVYALPPCVGLRSELPDAPVRCLTAVGRDKYENYVRCWSMDDDRRKNAARLGKFLADTGITDIGFHDWDTGAFLNPANWGLRCDVCKKRWGDDFAAATINKHRIIYEEIKKAAPDTRIHYTLYPYNISVLTQKTAEQYHISRYGPSASVPIVARKLRERFTEFWRQITGALPGDITFCIRENIPENVRRFHDLTKPHGTFAWYKVGSEQWQTFFDESPRWATTFYSGRDDLMFTVSLETFVPLKAMAVREYAWNVEAPGATGWAQLPQEERERHAEAKGEIYTVVLPHIVRNFFGRRAAPELTKALSLNMAMNHIFDHLPSRKRRVPVLTKYAKWNWQAGQAEKGAETLDALLKQFAASGDRLGMTAYAARRFVYIREVFHCCKWMARAKAYNMQARELAKEGKLGEARKAIQLGRETIAKAREDMKQLVAERPGDPIYNVRLDYKKRPFRWKIYTPDYNVDYGVPEKLLAQTEKELPSLAAAGELPKSAVDILAKRRTVHLAPASAPPEIDGRLDEPDWRRVLPVEALFVFPGNQGIARAHTRARFLRDEKTLYFGATCWMPDGAPIKAEVRERDAAVVEDEQVELFLMPPHMKGSYVHFQINAEGSLADKRVVLTRNKLGANVYTREPQWNAEGIVIKTRRQTDSWELEAAIPLSALGVSKWRSGWRVNVCRDFKGSIGARELSSIQQPARRNFHDTRYFHVLTFNATPAPPPDIQVAVAGLKCQTRTLDDRIATIVDFGLDVKASRMLHGVRVTAEAYDTSGRLHARRVVKQLKHLVYFWRPDEQFTIGFEQQIKAGGVRILLESDEARAERWVRIGSWQGTQKLGGMFASHAEGLIGLCNLPSDVLIPGTDQALRLVPQRRGTIELWFRPQWQSKHPLDERAPWRPRHALIHCGIMRREYPEHINQSNLTIYHDAGSGSLTFVTKNRSYAGWVVSYVPKDDQAWSRPEWHHVASVWDHDAKPEDWLRLYLDGKRVTGKPAVVKPERLGDDQAVSLDKTAFATQIGGLNTGRWTSHAAIEELRISRTARYDADFTPTRAPLSLDKATVALYHFDGGLDGQGLTEDGKRYAVIGVAGALEVH